MKPLKSTSAAVAVAVLLAAIGFGATHALPF
jgi:hypothetical protein